LGGFSGDSLGLRPDPDFSRRITTVNIEILKYKALVAWACISGGLVLARVCRWLEVPLVLELVAWFGVWKIVCYMDRRKKEAEAKETAEFERLIDDWRQSEERSEKNEETQAERPGLTGEKIEGSRESVCS
jgi:hypothetical protein